MHGHSVRPTQELRFGFTIMRNSKKPVGLGFRVKGIVPIYSRKTPPHPVIVVCILGIWENPSIITIVSHSHYYWVGVHLKDI